MGRTRSSLLRPFGARFWVEVGLGAASVFLLVLTYLVPDWIEVVLRVDPDHHSGSLEWALDGALVAVAVAAGVFARIEWRRPALGALAAPASSLPEPR
jgi:hypothetical protein